MPEVVQRRSNLAPWGGLLLALAALFVNAGFFLGVSWQKIIPVLSPALAIAALFFATVGVVRAFRESHVYGGKISSSVLGVLSLLLFALVIFSSVSARKLPGSAGAPQPGQKAPDFTLADTNGNKVSLGQLLSGSAAPTTTALAGATGVAGNAGGSAGPGGATSNAPKAVLLIFYRGYW